MYNITVGRVKMRNYLYVFIGGFAGGLFRVMAIKAENLFIIGGMDLTIMLINITGAFLLGLFLSGTARFYSLGPGMHLGITVGFFGAFTTFSSLSMEAVGLLQTGDVGGLVFYIFVSCIVGLGAAELGFRAGIGSEMMRTGTSCEIPPSTDRHHNLVPVPIKEEEEE
jgi:CrcB protein